MTGLFIALSLNIIGVAVVYFVLDKKIKNSRDYEKIIASIRTEVGQLVTQLNSTSDRNISVLEDRIRTMDQLLKEADKRIMLLKKEMDAAAREKAVYSNLNPVLPENLKKTITLPDTAQRSSPTIIPRRVIVLPVDKKEEKLQSSLFQVDNQVVAEEFSQKLLKTEHGGIPPEATAFFDSLTVNEKVMNMVGNGMDAKVIASALRISTGEVELIISIESKKKK